MTMTVTPEGTVHELSERELYANGHRIASEVLEEIRRDERRERIARQPRTSSILARIRAALFGSVTTAGGGLAGAAGHAANAAGVAASHVPGLLNGGSGITHLHP